MNLSSWISSFAIDFTPVKSASSKQTDMLIYRGSVYEVLDWRTSNA